VAQQIEDKMKRKMFGHRIKNVGRDSEFSPGKPMNNMDMPAGRAKDAPGNYEGKEHVRYRDPGHTRHEIDFPEDEPHMKSYNSKEEAHEMEDNYHMAVPDQTPHALAKEIKRARMHMDAPDQEDPKPLRGNIVHNVPYRGEEDTSGEEEMGPNDYQEEGHMPKEHRKKMIVAVMKRKMHKKQE
jgi:hypothetical protein